VVDTAAISMRRGRAFSAAVVCHSTLPRPLSAASSTRVQPTSSAAVAASAPSGKAILSVSPLGRGGPWTTNDPFLFCVHHLDHYPRGNERLGLDASQLRGRDLGQDFSGKEGFSMYHGESVPGFPQHPHRGFETITLVRKGLIDHSDSLGAQARFGNGDVQWLTAGRGISHSEMFPLIHREKDNPLELFQIWLNLPAKSKMVPPYFSMQWSEKIPTASFPSPSGNGAKTLITIVAGRLEGAPAPIAPPPDSWGASPDSDLAVWTVDMDASASWTLPPARDSQTKRTLFFYNGDKVRVDGREVGAKHAIQLRPDSPVVLESFAGPAQFLLLQGRPLGEPVAQRGPFVMNTPTQLAEAFEDYRRTLFGGWPHKEAAPVFPREQGRFAKHIDGRMETP
jgi:redox-sensitive bicupin YhaK (pirin superfamily)